MSKGYIKAVLFSLSFLVYASNNTLASERAANIADNINNFHQKNDIREKYTRMLCSDPDETEIAIKHANDAVTLLLKLYDSSIDDYSLFFTQNENATIYSKKHGNVDIRRFHATIPSAIKYSNVIKKLWDFDDTQKLDAKFINGNVVRVYSKNLIMMEQSSIAHTHSSPRKKYAIAAKVKVSNDTTVILCPSRTLNHLCLSDEKPNMKKILENTRSIEIGIDAEEALTKLGTNIAGFIIKKIGNNVEVTYINSIYDDGHSADSIHDKRNRCITYTNILSL
ncbi:fam-a protein [Plasmodium vinckei petteri]|uniref:Fam-a protein n=2 Tax=Plasmodium vinckei petteri TaxID=138298 RepID=A0A6V7SBC1_PLAVN|nr:fam-a protein [Plasmodium vinckei petteri]